MWGSRRERKSRSRIFEMLFKFEIGRKLAGSVEGSPGFLRIGETCANLNMVGKVPCAKDMFARLDIRTEKPQNRI